MAVDRGYYMLYYLMHMDAFFALFKVIIQYQILQKYQFYLFTDSVPGNTAK